MRGKPGGGAARSGLELFICIDTSIMEDLFAAVLESKS